MASVICETDETLADLLDRIGNVPLNRIQISRPLGISTEQDLLKFHGRTNRNVELVDGVLVEKAMGTPESMLAFALARFLHDFVRTHKLGIVFVADAMFRFRPDLIRMPDVSFVSWDRLPDRRAPRTAVPEVAPNLAVEVLSQSNTVEEMDRKCEDYFEAGVDLVWLVDPRKRNVVVLTEPGEGTTVEETGKLDGGRVLPGFELELVTLFAELDQTEN